MAFSQDQIIVAARAWLDSTRREWLRRNPGKDCFMPTWQSMTATDRMSVIKSIAVALAATDPANVQKVLERDAANDQVGGI